MKLAIICADNNLHATMRLSFHFLVAPKVLQKSEMLRWYCGRSTRGDFIIVDNGAPEGELVDETTLLTVAEAVRADEVILPDVLRNCDATLSKSTSQRLLSYVPPTKRFVVPQGKTWPEWRYCLNQLVKRCEPTTIGIAKWLEELPGGRRHALQIIYHNPKLKRYNIHLLGCARPFKVEIRDLNVSMVRSMDTALPIALAQQNLYIGDAQVRPSYQWDMPYSTRLAERNVEYAIQMGLEIVPCTFQ